MIDNIYMSIPSLRQLHFLVALADTLNFSRAAEICHVTQPTLSAGLKELEQSLGVVLAERTKRSVLLTPIGQETAERARRVLSDVNDIAEVARASGAGPEMIRLGAIPTIGPFLMPSALPLLRAAWPGMRIWLREELTDPLIDALRAGRLDLALMAQPYDLGNLEAVPLFDDGYQFAVSADTPLHGGTPISPPALAEMPLLLLERGHCLQRHALSAYPEVALHEDNSFAATSLATLISMVAQGLGATLLPQLAIDAGAARDSGIMLYPLPSACPRHVVLAWRRSSPHRAQFHRIAEVMRDARAALTRHGAER